MNKTTSVPHCPCGTNKDYQDCCGKYISGQESPPTPEALMRSRYTAYSLVDIEYIAKTMKSPAADNFDIEATQAWAKKIVWTQLSILNAVNNFVEFIAHYYADKKKYILHEISEFKFENGKWYYIDGIQPNKKSTTDSAKKIGRNDLCPCGSNKKYKKCCGEFH